MDRCWIECEEIAARECKLPVKYTELNQMILAKSKLPAIELLKFLWGEKNVSKMQKDNLVQFIRK